MNRAEIENKLRIRSAKELSLQMEGLVALAKVLNNHLDQWFLSGGTLLGACRDNDFIPWDWDVEVTVLTEEAKLKEGVLLKGLLEAGFAISSADSSFENFKIVASGWGTEYEILGRHLKSDNKVRARLTVEVPAHFFETFEVVEFRGYNFPAPSPADGFLQALYGDWKTPRKTADKRAYFSSAAYTKKSLSITSQRIAKVWKLLVPSQVREFPRVTEAGIERFKSWDAELGWCNQINATKVDNSDRSANNKKNVTGLSIFSTDAKGSRICRYPSANPDISFYGDSYCMCRDVQDEHTFPWYLGELRGSRVSNYGVGNYGLDQALLRLTRDYHKDPGKIVVLAVTSITMARCVSVYRHYLEPGNIFAIKPRFSLNENGTLYTVKYPLSCKQDLLKLEQYKRFFHQYDEHYHFWRKSRFDYYIHQLPRKVAARVGVGFVPQPFKKFEYEVGFWQSHERLFLGMMSYYQQTAERFGFRPVFLLQHHKRSLRCVKEKHSYQLPWACAISKAAEEFPAITFLDESDIFSEYNNIDELYNRSHHSPRANRMIAKYLDEKL